MRAAPPAPRHLSSAWPSAPRVWRIALLLCAVAAAVPGLAAAHDHRDTKRDYATAHALAAAARVELAPLPSSLVAPRREGPGPLQVGVHRQVAETDRDLASRLRWTPLAQGGMVAAAIVTSPGATFLRAAIRAKLGEGAELRYFRPGAPPLGHAVVTQADVADDIVWSPSVQGDSLGVEIVLPSAPAAPAAPAAPSAAALAQLSIIVAKVSHGTIGRAAAGFMPKAVACTNHVDVHCRGLRFRVGLERAVARVLFESAGGTYACTGTALRDGQDRGQALVLTANHCIATSVEAASVETTWGYLRASCGDAEIDRGATVYGGARLLATSVAQDSTLLALRGRLPAQVDFADWKVRQPAHPAEVIGIHHPGGDEMKFAEGVTHATGNAILGARELVRNAVRVRWNDGLTEGGSSGSGLFHDDALIGVLAGGDGSCNGGQDVYGSFADFYPRACPWLSSGDTCASGNAPLFLAAGDGRRESFLRIINHSGKPGVVRIYPTDDSGRGYEPIALSIGAKAALHFNSTDLEAGNPRKGIPRGVGAGTGHWRLTVDADVDIEVLSYVRTNGGFVTTMHDLAPTFVGGQVLPFFNPARNRDQASELRLVNPHEEDVEVAIHGVDDEGNAGGVVLLVLAAGQAQSFTASQLERGDARLRGALGPGAGKWRLLVAPSLPIRMMNLLHAPGGKLTNLSTFPPLVSWLDRDDRRAPFFASARHAVQQGFVRLSNYGETSATVSARAVDDAGRQLGRLSFELPAGASRHFNSDDLEAGNPAKGIAEGLGSGTGHWRLEFENLPASAHMFAYARSADGFLTVMHDVVPGPNNRHEVPFFNPASNAAQVSKLRLVNPTSLPAQVTIRGTDDQGEEAPGAVSLNLAAGASRLLASQQLESGGTDLVGALGDGSGKWRLRIAADQPIDVVNLLESPTGDIANLSTGTRPR